jgi:hypothetical protein
VRYEFIKAGATSERRQDDESASARPQPDSDSTVARTGPYAAAAALAYRAGWVAGTRPHRPATVRAGHPPRITLWRIV